MKYTFNIVMCQNSFSLFQTWHGAKHCYAVQFDSSFNELDVHSRSQDYGKGRTCAVILLIKLHEGTQIHDGWLYKGGDCGVL